jgi:FixJ family two-component response regulator
VLDARMPGMTGEEFLSSLKKHSKYLPTIVVSGIDDATTKKKVKEMKDSRFL